MRLQEYVDNSSEIMTMTNKIKKISIKHNTNIRQLVTFYNEIYEKYLRGHYV